MDIKNALSNLGVTSNKNANQNNDNRLNSDNNDDLDITQNMAASQEKVTLTSTASRLSQVKILMSGQPEVNKDRVAEIRKALAEGNYKINADRIASRMVNFESALRG